MEYGYFKLIMKMQEKILFQSLPKEPDLHPPARKRISDDLSKAVQKLVAHLAPETVLEIGAHEASFSRRMKSALPRSRIVAFEANPVVFDTYKSRVLGTGVDYQFKCIADENRSYKFSVPGTDRAHPTMGSVLRYTKSDAFATYDVDGVRLDDFLGPVTTPNAMWIDVEGAIGSVLAGAASSLTHCVLLFAELEAIERWEGQMLDVEVIALLASHGLVPVLRDIQRHKWQHNILFIREKSLSDPVVQKVCLDFIDRSPLAN
jgi:FkbM family methyltransferase